MPRAGTPAMLSRFTPGPRSLQLTDAQLRAGFARAEAGSVAVQPAHSSLPALHLIRSTSETRDSSERNGRTLELLRGRRAILKLTEQLRMLARECGQAGEADTLLYFMTQPDALKKNPWLIAERAPNGLLTSAVLLYEYRVGPFSTGVFATGDASGRRTVLAPPARRESVAAAAARRLMERGAAMVHIAFSRTHLDPESKLSLLELEEPGESVFRILPAGPQIAGQHTARLARARWSLGEREMRLYLPLAPSFDETLKHIGQRTRSNLRYYRRRAEAELGTVFVPNVEISRAEFIALDRQCRYAVGGVRAGWRYDSLARLRTPFLSGVRATRGEYAGQWLSLVGGRQQPLTAEIDWQMNRMELPASSLSTVLRAYLIEHMIAQGRERLYIEGGTPQPISLSFAAERVAELTVVSGSAYAWLLNRVGSALAPRKNYLAAVLRQPGLSWHSL